MLINKSRKKLLKEILDSLILSAIIALISAYFLYLTSVYMSNKYLYSRDLALTAIQHGTFIIWIKSICFFSGVIIFISVFLFFIGQKISYLSYIISSVENLKQKNMNFVIDVEGNNELTELAESINYLSLSQRELHKQEEYLKNERENMIRSLSHDIRTPLTSIISYAEYLKTKDSLKEEEFFNYLNFMQLKAEQIKLLADKLLGEQPKSFEMIEDGRLLIEQLIIEWEAILEEKFEVIKDFTNCDDFKCVFRVEEIRRIFDNNASNIEKYADPKYPIKIMIEHKEQNLIIIQENIIKNIFRENVESHKIGLNNIQSIVDSYDGKLSVIKDDNKFKMTITLKTIN